MMPVIVAPPPLPPLPPPGAPPAAPAVVPAPPPAPPSAATYTGTDGTVYVPESVVMAGASPEALATMGVLPPGGMSNGFNFNYVSRTEITTSLAPEDSPRVEGADGAESPA